MESNKRNLLILFVICVVVAIGTGSQLSFDESNTNIVFMVIFIIVFSYITYFFLFGIIVYHKKITYYTIQKIQTKLENTLSCSDDLRGVLKLGDLAFLISFLSISIIITNSPETFSSVVPGDDIIFPMIKIVLEKIGIVLSDDPLKISLPHISSIKFIMLSSIGPIIVFALRLMHNLQLRNTMKLPKKERKQSKQDEENKQFPGVTFLITFLLISPLILIISRIATPNGLVFDIALVMIAISSVSGWLYVWFFLRFFEKILFVKLFQKSKS